MNQFASPPDWASQVDAPDATPSLPMLEVEALCRRFAGVAAVEDVGFRVAPGQVTCLLGPSGCGKSTTLRMIAGIERPDSGAVRIAGRPMSGAGAFLPPERRPVGMVFQDFALFPHLDVAANVGFGLRGPARQDRDRIAALLERVGLSGHAAKYPHELSGGEQQRVALIRALAPRPCLMLMDEPFSSLDHRLRDGVRDAALDLLRETETAVVMVTHDPEEAMLMGHRIAVMRRGRLIQEGRPDELYNRPADRGVAAFFSDLNIVAGRVAGGRVQTVLGAFPAPGLAEGSRAEVAVRPQHLVPAEAGGTPARVERARYLGRESLIEIRLEPGGAAMKSRIPGLVLPAPGSLIRVAVQPGSAMVFAGDGE
ncbi:ABC transporter ATP-binding protein (plasmid) [Paracoccus versutus]|uniref:Iron(III) transport system ATP-binding protein n=1 Tax=Paracoccus versutus TaxID=34007 RepID=A0AAQ0HIR7_PARVE|nr:ABC transporter ATP-binding protein [Paracoccus versutus]REG47022.1 iron(III) transport system ATP-binding protein [Paracoccus versutus]WEJ82206.1 ABC transporter ATP-binding protein [Paracoccus versutus]WGR63566.1 ABC transporter ATP-binding protein [Paracoccus ferrooxidans]SFX94310.1 iron(III) transport system ATP-binding protein [Paracoccus pantotrophus]